MSTPKITAILAISAMFACGRTLPIDLGEDIETPETSAGDGDGDGDEPGDGDGEAISDVMGDGDGDPAGDGDGDDDEPPLDLPAEDECACVDPSPGDGDGDPAGDGDGDQYCGCGIIGAEDSLCFMDGVCAYFHGGCPDGWQAICAA